MAYLVTDDRGIVIEANQTATELLNVDDRFLRSKPLATFIVPAHRTAARQRILAAQSCDGPLAGEWDISPRRRPPVPAAFTVTRLHGGGQPDALLWLIQDLSAMKALRSRAAQLTEELRRSNPDVTDPDHPAVAQTLRELSGILLDEVDLDEILESVAAAATNLIPGAAGASVSLFEQGRPRVGGVSAPWVQALDETQYGLQEGPCVAALEDGEWRASDNLDEDARWPRFSAEATAQGVLAALSIPLLTRGARLGVLNIYGSNRNAFDGGATTIAQRLAERASVVVANAQMLSSSRRLSHELEQALTTRATVDMAKGILMARLGLDADGAFEALRDLSQRRHVKLRDLAAELVGSSSTGPRAADGGQSGGGPTDGG